MQDRLGQIEIRLRECMLRDRRRLGDRARRLVQLARRGGAGVRELEDLAREVDRALERRRRREASIPALRFPEELPVVARMDDIASAIRDHQVVVVCGETGSGKTTQLPKICLGLGRGLSGMIGHTQPRRIAARSVATRLSEELASPLGRAVGYKVRFGDQTGPDTLIKVMTDGILLAETQGDRMLEAYDTLIIDEAHERSLNIDFLLGYVKKLLTRRADLKVIVTSATIDPQRFAAHFAGARGPAPIIEVSGRTYPVEVRYRPLTGDEEEQDLSQEEAILAAVDDLCAIEPSGHGDILVFMATEREIRETAVALRAHHPPATQILPLYARLSAQEQMRVFQPHGGRRIVLATNVAETSLTVPGIRYVIDPGSARISRYNPRTKVQRLPIEAVSRASADQRKGRCGRVAAGVCVRLYSEQDYLGRDQFTEPEILRTNLASVILQMKALRLGAVEEFPFIEPPEPRMIRDGYDTLRELGAVDGTGNLTTVGRELARLPLDPRLGRMILAAEKEGCLSEVLVIAAALSVQDPRERPLEKQEAADQAHRRFRDENSDFMSYLNLWKFYHEEAHHKSGSTLRRMCRDSFLSFMRMRDWHDVRQQLHALMTEMGKRINPKPADPASIHRALLAGLLSTVGKRDPETPEYAGARGTKFYVFPGSALFKQAAKWIMAAEVVTTTRTYGRTVAKIDPAWIEEIGAHALSRSYFEPHWSGAAGQVFAFERVTLFGLEIVGKRRVAYGAIDPVVAREIFIQNALVEGELRTEGSFLVHNRAMVERVRVLEAKARRTDLLADARRRFAFYDARVPADVCTSHRFEGWRREAERKNSRILCMTERDLIVADASEITPERYPDAVPIGGSSLGLTYVCDPVGPADGVTLKVPLEMLGQLDARSGETLVPGMLREKVEAVVKTLPRSVRKYVGKEIIERCVAGLEAGPGVGRSMLDVIAAEIERVAPLGVTAASFNVEELPAHLRMNFRVVDALGAVVGEGRDLGALRRELADKVRASFGSLAPAALDGRRVTDWDFGELPEVVTLWRSGITVRGYPALCDDGEGVTLRLYDTPEAASEAMRAGLRRLFFVRAAEEVRHSVRTMEHGQRMMLCYSTIAPGSSLVRDVSLLAAERAFMPEGAGSCRGKPAFDAALTAGWARVRGACREVETLVAPILEAFHGATVRLSGATAPAFVPACTDIRGQIKKLVYDGFLTATPWERLGHLARYLGAVDARLGKLLNAGLARDTRDMEQVRPHWERYLRRRAELVRLEERDDALDQYRWMIEEMRVSLFAQHMGTPGPISLKRLDDQWARVRR